MTQDIKGRLENAATGSPNAPIGTHEWAVEATLAMDAATAHITALEEKVKAHASTLATVVRERNDLRNALQSASRREAAAVKAAQTALGRLETWLLGSRFTKPKTGQIILHLASVERAVEELRAALQAVEGGEGGA